MKNGLKRRKIRWYLLFMMSVCMCQIMTIDVCATQGSETASSVTELDLGDYQLQMKVGERQLLSVTPLPETVDDVAITYKSSDTKVAKINGMGRITALSEGVTEISISCGTISEKFKLTVVSNLSTVTDLDVGDCPSELEVGSSQMLNVTPIPMDAGEYAFAYTSSDTRVATVNAIGRITAVAVGKTKITVTCGKISKTFSVKVIESKEKEVTDIEIADYEDELEVDKTMNLSVTVLPSDATDNNVTYQSSDERIATVSSTGEVKGISAGKVVITVLAGNIAKKIELTVKIATSKIELNTTYLVMQIGEAFQLKATVLPEDADRTITYKSMDPDIVTVSAGGTVSAKKCGSTTIVVKNKDTSSAVSVIVNAGGQEVSTSAEWKDETENIKYDTVIYAKECPLITADMLRYYYENQSVVTIYGDGYSMQIDGKNILNWNNEIYTQIEFVTEHGGIGFYLNRNKNICGTITLCLDKELSSGKYLYLYNESKNKYELIKQDNPQQLELDTEGKYIVTDKKLEGKGIKIVVIIVAIVITLALILVYIITKKRYWFW